MAIAQDNRRLLERLRWLRVAFALIVLLMVGKLWQITVLQFDHFQTMADRNQLRTLPDLAPRGLIVDRDGRVLVDNVYTFNLLFYRDEVDDPADTLEFIQKAIGFSPARLEERLEAAARYPRVRPVVMAADLSVEQAAYLLAHQAERPELRVVEQPTRRYRNGGLLAHTLGYVGEITEAQLTSTDFEGFRAGDVVGQSGLELRHNSLLTGKDGYHRALVNSIGKTLDVIETVPPEQGQELRLTIDLDLQTVAERELAGSPGAVVALDARNGEVLALASHPTFDPNLFASRISADDWNALLQDPDHPLQHRAIQSSFSPGSLFKITMALAALEQGVISPETREYCNGSTVIYGNRFDCWFEGGHGSVNLHEAIQHSCNVYFYHLGRKLGIEKIERFSRLLGLGQLSGIDLQGEASGLVPSEAWKRRTTGQPWYRGETISVAIGQGPINATPIQLAQMMRAVATGLVPSAPRLTPTQSEPAIQVGQRLALETTHLAAVQKALWSVVNAGGTGRAARVAGFDVCGKTGTAQTISKSAYDRLDEELKKRFAPNAWFAGFAPRDNPEIVVVVIVQRGGAGSGAGARLAGHILDTYYQKHYTVTGLTEIALN